MKLNLGSGNQKLEGYINCDISEDVNPDMVMDISKEFPFKDNCVTEIVMTHVLEHFLKPLDILKEIYRVCKDGAFIRIRVPYYSNQAAHSMLDHYSTYTFTSFDLLDKNHINHWQGVGDFETIYKKLKWRKELFFFELLFNLFPRVYQELFANWFPANELVIILKVRK